MGLDRQAALWHIRTLRDESLPLFRDESKSDRTPNRRCLRSNAPRQVVNDYGSVGLSLKAHPLSFLRAMLDKRGITAAVETV